MRLKTAQGRAISIGVGYVSFSPGERWQIGGRQKDIKYRIDGSVVASILNSRVSRTNVWTQTYTKIHLLQVGLRDTGQL